VYGSTTNGLNQLSLPNRFLLEKLGVFQIEKKSSRQFVTLFTWGRIIQSTTYRSISLRRTWINSRPLLLQVYPDSSLPFSREAELSNPQLTALYLYGGLELIPVLFFSKCIGPSAFCISVLKTYMILSSILYSIVGPYSAVVIMTCYELDGQGFESFWGRSLPHSSRPSVVPTQRPMQWLRDHSSG